MKKTTRSFLILAVYLVPVFQHPLPAQDTTKLDKELKNTIHYNITNPVIFGGGSIIFGYERILKNYRSFSINIGQANFPTLSIVTDDSVRDKRLQGKAGFHISGDYRFYFAKHNKYAAPRGVYMGPYYSYNYFKNEHSWEIRKRSGEITAVESKTTLNVHTLGLE